MLDQFKGQRDALAPLLVAIAASERTGRPLPNALFLGGPGRGKTTLAHTVAQDLNLPFVTLHGSSVIERGAISDKIMEAKGGILFIDEIHRLPVQIAEDLYRVIDEGKLAVSEPVMETVYRDKAVWYPEWHPDVQLVWYGPGYYRMSVGQQVPSKATRTVLTDVSPITILGATTDEALLAEPFYSRLSALIVRLRPYTVIELAQIAIEHGLKLGVTFSEDAADVIAKRSRNTPRLVKQYTERVVDWTLAMSGTDHVNMQEAEQVMSMLGIDAHGLSQPHRDILSILTKATNGLSRTSLAQQLRLPPRNVEGYWAALAEAGFVEIDTRHRITEEGKAAYA